MKTRILRSVILPLLLLVATPTLWSQDSTEADDPGWPREINSSLGIIVIYQPQYESFSNDQLEAQAAVSVTTPGNKEPEYGAVWLKAQMATDLETRMVSLVSLKVTDTRFPDTSQVKTQHLSKIIETEFPKWGLTISLDRLLADVEATGEAKSQSLKLNNGPPEVVFVTYPAVLIRIDGEPVLKDIEDMNYKYVVNTPYFIVQSDKTNDYYLKGGDYWYTTSDIQGTWTPITNPPHELVRLADRVIEDTHANAVPMNKEHRKRKGSAAAPAIIIKTKPAELLQTDGQPQWTPIDGTSLIFVKNTSSNIFMDVTSQEYYILLSGRWYESKSLTGNDWTYVASDKLPADFTRIPADSDKGNVLANVAGTPQAKEAVLEAQIPQTAQVDRKDARETVTYAGDPKFVPIKGTHMAYAVNTDKAVLLIDGKYYVCDQAVWFVGDSPEGPWTVSVSVPDEVLDLPPDVPVYNVKYVYIYDYTPDIVYMGYTPSYLCSYIYGPTVVYGTGFYYDPWFGLDYFPRPWTFGFDMAWFPYIGWCYGFDLSLFDPYYWFGLGWYSPFYAWWGPAGYYRGYNYWYYGGYHYGYAGHRDEFYYGSNLNVYRNRRSGVLYTGIPRTERYNAYTEARPAQMGRNPAFSRGRNNIYTDRQGNIYRRSGSQWQMRENGQWRTVTPMEHGAGGRKTVTQQPRVRPGEKGQMISPAAPRPSPAEIRNLNRAYQARSRGAQQAQTWQMQRPYFQRPSQGFYNNPPEGYNNRPAQGYFSRPPEGYFNRPQGMAHGSGGRR